MALIVLFGAIAFLVLAYCVVAAMTAQFAKSLTVHQSLCPHGNCWDDCPDCRH